MKHIKRHTLLLVNLTALVLLAPVIAFAQTINIDRVVAELEPEIHRTLLAGNIPSASIALVSGDQVIWSGAYGQSNLWARTPSVQPSRRCPQLPCFN